MHQSDSFYFTRLSLSNVRAFKSKQELLLCDDRGRPSSWNLILGENGVGKTTLMQCLIRMKPVPTFKRDEQGNQAASGDSGPPDYVEPELSERENPEMISFIRRDARTSATIEARLSNARLNDATNSKAVDINVGAEIELEGADLGKIKWTQSKHALKREGPLVLAYGAGRHVGHANLTSIKDREQNDSMFAETMDLYDAVEVLQALDFAVWKPGASSTDTVRYEDIKAALASLVPDVDVEGIKVLAPEALGRSKEETGVQIKTKSGVVPLSDLSTGCQTMFAWTLDLAWRLVLAYPDSEKPLHESAIVLIDEIDLHLHPRWQRSLREHLLRNFPAVQFVATTHSPVTAQESIAAGANVSVVRWDGDEAHIYDNPLQQAEWRVDQVLMSDLFDFSSVRSPAAEEKLKRRKELVRKRRRTKLEEIELAELDEFAASLPTAPSPDQQRLMDAPLVSQ